MRPDPLILGFDTSAAHCAAALSSDGEVRGAVHAEMARGQSERLVPMLEALLREGGVTWRDVTALGVGVGPGNFTGIRIAVATARGLALALGIPAVGVSTFEALAFGAPPGPVLASVDARQSRAHLQPFADGLPDGAPYTVDLAEVPDSLRRPGLAVVGFAAEAIAERLAASPVPCPVYPVHHAVALIAASRFRTATGRPAPLYIRPADAAPSREAPPVILQ